MTHAHARSIRDGTTTEHDLLVHREASTSGANVTVLTDDAGHALKVRAEPSSGSDSADVLVGDGLSPSPDKNPTGDVLALCNPRRRFIFLSERAEARAAWKREEISGVTFEYSSASLTVAHSAKAIVLANPHVRGGFTSVDRMGGAGHWQMRLEREHRTVIDAMHADSPYLAQETFPKKTEASFPAEQPPSSVERIQVGDRFAYVSVDNIEGMNEWRIYVSLGESDTLTLRGRTVDATGVTNETTPSPALQEALLFRTIASLSW